MPEKIACYAVSETTSRCRLFSEKRHPYRTPFERDRDRIVHCSAFRRLEGKTQVFTPGINDDYRTRLTHSIEVSQIGRTIAKTLNLNESLTEAICLGHDLGHSPFGHSGEQALNKLMAGFGGFEHNRQTLRIVDLLEHPYPDFSGLNLMYETRLGFARHHGPYDKPAADDFSEACCSLEGQVADIADRIAYNCHDLEDGIQAGLINEQQLKNITLFADAQAGIKANSIEDATIRRTRTAKSIIDILVSDCIEASKKTLAKTDIKSPEDVYTAGKTLIVLSQAAQKSLVELEKFLLENMYNHSLLKKVNSKVQTWLGEVFEKFCKQPALMPKYYQRLIPGQGLERTVCDYIAGMTDRFCQAILGES